MTWIPKIGYGPFRFGNPLPSNRSYQKLEPSCEDADWDVFQLDGVAARVAVTEGRITSLEFWDEFYFKSTNIIGKTIVECSGILGCGFDLFAEHFGELEYCNEQSGITLWVENDVVTGVTIHGDC